MIRVITSSVVLSCLALVACGGGSGGSSSNNADPTVDPDPTMMDDDVPTGEGGAAQNPDNGSGGADDVEPEPEPEPEPDPSDETAPSVLSVSPEAAAKGVLTDDVIVIQFSEAMDEEATEAAYSSDDLPGVTFSWNDASTELTITPNAPLEYSIGFDPEVLVANSYSYVLADTAKDLAGNPLEADLDVSFDMARMLLAEGPLVPAYSGSIDMETGDLETTLKTGDLASGHMSRAYVTFTLPELPADRLELLVVLETSQTGITGSPFAGLTEDEDQLQVAAATFDTAVGLQEIEMFRSIGELSESEGLGPRSLEVTEPVGGQYADGEGYAQFIVQFPLATDGDANEDTVLFDHNSTRLAIAYLLE